MLNKPHNTMQPKRAAGLPLRLTLAFCGASLLGLSGSGRAQATSLAPPTTAADYPRPSFPVAERKQSQFTVEFVYRYFESDYKPAVPVRVLPKPATTADTPEHALIGLISAASSLDYEWWLSQWDTTSQQLFRDDVTSLKHDAAFWKRLWQRGFQGREVTLVKRLEAGQYVILEYRLGPAPVAGQPDRLLFGVFRQIEKKWVSTRALDDSGFFTQTIPGVDNAPRQAEFAPTPAFSGKEATNFTEPQKLFFTNEPRGAQSATRVVW